MASFIPRSGSADLILPVSKPLSLTEILASLSYALDLTSGQPMGHAQRSCIIGMRIADVVGLDPLQRKSLYPALLIKDAGCSTNAARMYEIFGGSEIDAKRMSKVVDWSNLIEAAKYAANCTLPKGSLIARARQFMNVAEDSKFGNKIIDARCNRGAEIAKFIGLSDDAAGCIRGLDEHWDGKGSPYKLKGDAIPMLARIACLSQTLEVFAKTFDVETAYHVLKKRSGKWFDPELVKAAFTFRDDPGFWQSIYRADPADTLAEMDVETDSEMAGEGRIDSVCEAFAGIVDAKSPFTADHSSRVSQYTVMIASELGITGDRLTLLRRASLLHDIGKLAVPNSILDFNGKPSDDDWQIIKRHPYYTFEILRQIKGFERMAYVAGAHHEKLNGGGYYIGLSADRLDLDMRILAVADIFDALSAERPYRGALSLDEVFKILDKDAGIALDVDAVEAMRSSALREAAGRSVTQSARLAA